MEKELRKFFKSGELVEIMYLAKDGTITKRKIKILKMYGDKFQAYCFTRRDKRTFLTDRVLAVLPLNFKKKKAI